jgi:hypothetical protein
VHGDHDTNKSIIVYNLLHLILFFQAHNKTYPENIKSFMNVIEKHALQHLSDSFLSPPDWTRCVAIRSCDKLRQCYNKLVNNKLSQLKIN